MSDFRCIIDIGTNSFHLIIAELTGGKKFNIVQREKVIMRLGTEGEGVLRRISDGEMKRAAEVLRDFKKLADFYNAGIYAVATSAVRESSNREEFTLLIKRETGINIMVIDGETEALYIFEGVRNALPVEGKKVLCIDIGGGSTEVIIGRDSAMDFIKSFRLGAVRLTKMFFPEYIVTRDVLEKCTVYIERKILDSGISGFREGYDIAVGSSGTIRAIAAIIAAAKYNAVVKDLNGFSFDSDELKEAADLVLKFPTLEERTMINGMEKGRADILPAGMLILIKLFEILSIKELHISTFSLKEGFLLKMLAQGDN